MQTFFIFHKFSFILYYFYYNFSHCKQEITPQNGIKKRKTFALFSLSVFIFKSKKSKHFFYVIIRLYVYHLNGLFSMLFDIFCCVFRKSLSLLIALFPVFVRERQGSDQSRRNRQERHCDRRSRPGAKPGYTADRGNQDRQQNHRQQRKKQRRREFA